MLCYYNCVQCMHAGPLRAVSNLTVVPINSTTVLISWSPPFTLEGVPILGYNVTVTNTTSGENETMSVEGDTTMLYYSIDHPDPDNNFTVTVTVVPINGAGLGEDHVTTFVSFGEHNVCIIMHACIHQDFLQIIIVSIVYSTISATSVFTSDASIFKSTIFLPSLSSTTVFGELITCMHRDW